MLLVSEYRQIQLYQLYLVHLDHMWYLSYIYMCISLFWASTQSPFGPLYGGVYSFFNVVVSVTVEIGYVGHS